MEERFDVEFAGEILSGFDKPAVQAAVATLFKADEATLSKLFSGERLRIKRNCDAATAQRFADALARAGARTQLIPLTQPTAEDGELTLAPAGSLIPGLARPSGIAPDVSALSLAPLGTTLGVAAAAPPTIEPPQWDLLPDAAPDTANGVEQ